MKAILELLSDIRRTITKPLEPPRPSLLTMLSEADIFSDNKPQTDWEQFLVKEE